MGSGDCVQGLGQTGRRARLCQVLCWRGNRFILLRSPKVKRPVGLKGKEKKYISCHSPSSSDPLVSCDIPLIFQGLAARGVGLFSEEGGSKEPRNTDAQPFPADPKRLKSGHQTGKRVKLTVVSSVSAGDFHVWIQP